MERVEDQRNPIPLLTVGYVLALVIIALMSLCIHVVIGKVVEEQNSAAVVMSARQSQLAQKIVFYAGWAAGQEGVAAGDFSLELKDAVGIMRESHRVLVNGDKAMGVPSGMSEALSRIYFAQPYNLDQKVTEFIEKAEIFAPLVSGGNGAVREGYARLMESARPLNEALDAALMEYEAESEARIAKLQSYQKMALFIIFATLVAEAVLIFRPLVTRAHNYAERLKRMALTDGLTGVDNSRNFMQKAAKELRRSRRHGRPLCVVILDLDYFKKINDKYGHLAGDDVLRTVARRIQNAMRIEDEFARIGGEEFAALLPDTNIEGGKIIAERIRGVVAGSPVFLEDGTEIAVTASIGLAEVDPQNPDFEAVLNIADKALYKAKEHGRNRVVWSEQYSSAGADTVIRLDQSRKA